jgi:transposase
MSMRKRNREPQDVLFVATSDLPQGGGHPFYERLNRVLDQCGFDDYVEHFCQPYYAPKRGRPSIPPGVYFRMLMIGYFEGLDSERGIAWRVADSLSLRRFLGCSLSEPTPDHSSLSRIRGRLDVEVHERVFTFVLTALAKVDLVKAKTVGLDATTLEANAALRSIVRRDTGEGYESYLTKLAQASGIATPTRADLAKLDKKRKNKGNNDDWQHPHDPDARIAKMKDGRTHLAHKAEHAVDLVSGAVVAVTVQPADEGDTTTWRQTVETACQHLNDAKHDPEAASKINGKVVEELVNDKGYHSNQTMVDLREIGIRSYTSEPDRGKRHWRGKPEAREAVYANRRRIRGRRGKRLLRQRGELVERSFAHTYETGRMRRTHLRGHEKISKRLLVHVAGFNLGLLMRHLFSIGTPRSLQDAGAALRRALLRLLRLLRSLCRRRCHHDAIDQPLTAPRRPYCARPMWTAIA